MTEETLESTPSGALPEAGTLVIYGAKWVPVARFVAAMAEQLRSKGQVVDEIDVDERSGEVPTSVVVLPTFIYWSAKGPRVRTGACTAAELLELCQE